MPPMYPNQPPAGRVDPQGAPWPGLIPLRPLAIPEIFGASLRLVRTHAAVLCVVALIGTLLSAGATIVILLLLPDDSAYFDSSRWIDSLSAGVMTAPPAALLWPPAAGAIISFVTTIIVSGLATTLAADDALGRTTGTGAALARLRGRWGVLVGVSLVVGVLVAIGFVVFIIPGLILLAMLLLATPIAVLEKSGVRTALRRSTLLSAGSRGRILGVTVLAYLISGVLSTVLLALMPTSATLSSSGLTLIVSAVISSVTLPWTAGVVALLYIDTRIRKENLASTLIRASMSG